MMNGLLILGGIILVGVLGKILFEKTHIPESLFLIVMGILIGPVFGWVPREFLLDNISFFVTIALIIVLIDSGLNLDIYRTAKNTGYALIYTIVVVALTTAAIALLMQSVFGWPLLNGLFLGLIVSGTTTVTIAHLLGKLTTDPQTVVSDTKNILFIESVLSDLIIIAGAGILLAIAGTGEVSGQSLFTLAFNIFVVSLVFGAILGTGWIFLYVWKLHGNKLSYIFTVGLAFVIYACAEYLGMSGALTVAAFGLVLGNHKVVADHLRVRTKLFKDLDKDISAMKKTDTEFTFLITTFFFVLLGTIFEISVLSNTTVLLIAALLLATKFIARYLSSVAMTPAHSSFRKARLTHTTMMACGVASALVAFLALEAGMLIPFLVEIVLLLVVLTTLASIIGTWIQQHKTHEVIEDRKS